MVIKLEDRKQIAKLNENRAVGDPWLKNGKCDMPWVLITGASNDTVLGRPNSL